jgi:hypothetical protein|tara:strand:+ start:281 stop:598 length:318 start_codon:yes stop_codon:yes gene_type:complete
MEFKHKWEFDSEDEVESIFTDGKKELNDLIVDVALDNLHTKIENIPVVSIHTKDTDTLYDIMIERPDMIETLEQNLISMEEYEDYERCSKIIKAIDYLKLNTNKI